MAKANRVVAVVGAACLFFLALSVVIVFQLDAAGAVERTGRFAEWLDGRTVQSVRLTATIAGGVVAALAAVFLGLTLAVRRRRDTLRVAMASGEVVELPIESAERLLASDLGQLPHVVAARTVVRRAGDAAQVSVDLDLDAHAVISDVTRAVSRAAVATLTEKLGVRLKGKPTVTVHYDELVLQQRTEAPKAAGVAPLEGSGEQRERMLLESEPERRQEVSL